MGSRRLQSGTNRTATEGCCRSDTKYRGGLARCGFSAAGRIGCVDEREEPGNEELRRLRAERVEHLEALAQSERDAGHDRETIDELRRKRAR